MSTMKYVTTNFERMLPLVIQNYNMNEIWAMFSLLRLVYFLCIFTQGKLYIKTPFSVGGYVL